MTSYRNPYPCTVCDCDPEYIEQCTACDGTGSLKHQKMHEKRPQARVPGLERLPGAPPSGLVRSKVTQILLDMDDVLVDCTGAIMRHMGLPTYNIWEDYPTDIGRDVVMAYERATGVRYEDSVFWEHFKREFWANIPKTPWCTELVNFAQSIVGRDNVYLCTSPTKCGDCLAGKLDWIETNLPTWFSRQYVMTPRKEVCAVPGSILIDDADCNVDAFNEAGGLAVTLPAPWNKNRDRMRDPMDFIEEWFDKNISYGTV